MSAPSTVRIAKPDDYSEVWRLFLTGYRESGLFTLAPEKINWLFTRILNPEQIPLGDTGTRGAIGVIGTTGSLEGMVLLTLGAYWYSYDLHLEEYFVAVDPEHRKSNHAHALIQWMKDQVEVTGLPLVTGVISNIRTEAKCRLYRRMLPKIGEFFFLGPKGSNMAPGLVAASS